MNVEVRAAQAGSTVLYIADSMDEACTILNAEADAPGVESMRRVNGREQIRYSNGGRLIFTSTRNQGHRGYSADVVSVSAHTHANPDYMASVYPCMDTRAQARIIVRLD